MKIDNKIFSLWKKISPLGAFCSGLKQYAGKVWIPTKENEKKALTEIDKLLKKCKKDRKATKFLRSVRRGFLFEEPNDPPGAVMSYLYNHFLVEGFKENHIRKIADGCGKSLDVKKYLLKKDWPAEIKILGVLSCDGCFGVISTAKNNIKKESTKKKLDALAGKVKEWRNAMLVGKIKKGDFTEVFPLLKKYGKGFRREKIYPKLLKDYYDYPESAKEIESKALGWLEEDLPKFKAICAKLASKLNCKNNIPDIDVALKKKYNVPLKQLIRVIVETRRLLQDIAEESLVKITPKYDVRVVETPSYMVPFMPSGAMSPFGTLTKKPFCVYFATNDKRGSPNDCLPEIFQLTIHEEHGHCVNFMNSYTGYLGKLRLVEILGSSLDTPITEGLSFHREIELLEIFRHLEHEYMPSKAEKNVINFINKYSDLETFNDAMEYVVRKWRVGRFLRAISDSRVNSGKQNYAAFVEWANKKTGLPKKRIYDLTFTFFENPGYSPNYSIFGQRLAELQRKAMSKGISRVEFNTFVASKGFPARRIFEKQLKEEFKI